MTIYQIAKKLGISPSTVSRAVNPETRGKVAAATLAQVDRWVKKSGYTPNLAARQLRRASYETIGLVMPHFEGLFSHEYYTAILSGVSDAILHSHYRFKLILLKQGRTDWQNLKACEGVDGLVIVYCPLFHADKKSLSGIRIPSVVINDFEEKIKAHFVCGDNFMGGKLAAEYLQAKGHRNVALVTDTGLSSDFRLRADSFRAAFARKGSGARIFTVHSDSNDEPEASTAVEAFLQTQKPVTAFFCVGDRMAFGTIRTLRRLGIRCPQDVSVLGYDDNPRAEAFDPPLTTIRVPLPGMAKEAVRRLVGYLKDGSRQNFYYQKTVLPVSLVERASVKGVRS